MNDSPVHLIVTRMGIGVRRASFYEEHLKIASLALAPSLSAQQCPDFIWAVAIDSRAPKGIEEKIKALAPKLNVEVWRRDPFSVGLAPLDRGRIAILAGSKDILISRIDDDDILHRDFVGRAHADLIHSPSPAGLTYCHGANLFEGCFYTESYPWFSAGLTTKSAPDLKLHAYRYSHTQMGSQIEAIGGIAWEKDSETPMWIRTWRASSDSTAARGFRISLERPLKLKLEDYGLTASSMVELNLTLARSAQVEDLGVKRRQALPRMHLKNEMLRQIRNAISRGAGEDELEALRQTMYLI